MYSPQAGTYTEFMTVFCNVFLGMQLALSSYLQVCFSITNDVVMSISLMYEKPESGTPHLRLLSDALVLTSSVRAHRPHAPQASKRTHGPPDRLAVLLPDLPRTYIRSSPPVLPTLTVSISSSVS